MNVWNCFIVEIKIRAEMYLDKSRDDWKRMDLNLAPIEKYCINVANIK